MGGGGGVNSFTIACEGIHPGHIEVEQMELGQRDFLCVKL